MARVISKRKIAELPDSEKAVPLAQWNGEPWVLLGPADDPEKIAEIVTSTGVLCGPDCEVTISYAQSAGVPDLDKETAVREL